MLRSLDLSFYCFVFLLLSHRDRREQPVAIRLAVRIAIEHHPRALDGDGPIAPFKRLAGDGGLLIVVTCAQAYRLFKKKKN
jgi:hypothetical protein